MFLNTINAACVDKYFNDEELDREIDETVEDSIYTYYKAVLDSKSTDETNVSSCISLPSWRLP